VVRLRRGSAGRRKTSDRWPRWFERQDATVIAHLEGEVDLSNVDDIRTVLVMRSYIRPSA